MRSRRYPVAAFLAITVLILLAVSTSTVKAAPQIPLSQRTLLPILPHIPGLNRETTPLMPSAAGPQQLALVGQAGGYSESLDVSGAYTYVGTGPRLFIYTGTTPAVLVGQTGPLVGQAWNVSVSGQYAFLADGLGGLVVVDVSNPAAPNVVTSFPTSDARDVQIVGNTLYLADGDGTLYIFDISNPTAPAKLGSYHTPGYALGVAVNGNYAYVADGFSGMRVINVANPAAPTEVGSVGLPDLAMKVAASGKYAYVADLKSGLRVIDVSTPSAPVEVGSYAPSGYNMIGVTVSGSYAYLTSAMAGAMLIIDVSTPTAPSQVGAMFYPGQAHETVIVGTRAYIANGWTGYGILDITNPALPKLLGGSTPKAGGQATGIAVSGNYAYVADFDPGLSIIDVSNPNSPVQVAMTKPKGCAFSVDVQVQSHYAYVAIADPTKQKPNLLQIYDITAPSKPLILGSATLTDQPQNLAVSGSYAYLAIGNGGLQVVNISNPAAPKVVATAKQTSSTNGVFVLDNYAYLATNGGMTIIDVTTPAAPKKLGSVSALGFSVAVAGNYAYLAGGSFVFVVDVSSKLLPKVVSWNPTDGEAKDIVLNGNRAFVTEASAGVRVLDTTNPSALQEVAYYDTPVDALDVAFGVVNGTPYTFVADSEGGLDVLK